MKQINLTLLDSLTAEAKTSERQRTHFNLHPQLSDPVQRLCVAVEPRTYIRPHRHADPQTSEVFLLLRGSAVLLFFDEGGGVTERVSLAATGPVVAVEIPAATWHALASLESGTVFFEVKQGPYVQPTGEHVAAWAPAEGEPLSDKVVQWYKTAQPGDRFTLTKP